MQLARKRLGAVALAACLLVALAVGAVSAFADVTWQGDGFEGSLTVTATATGDDAEAIAADMADANVAVDVYQVATVAKDAKYDTYNYTWVEGFRPGVSGTIDTSNLAAEDWQSIADDCAKHISGVDHITGALDEAMGQLSDGLYLIVAHGSDKDITFDQSSGAAKLIADSPYYEYTFQPALVSIPTKAGGNTASPEPWSREASVNLKFEREPRYGDIKILKSVVNGGTEKATFAFHLVGTTPAGEAYENYASVFYDGDNASPSTVVEHIPAGTVLTVTEQYTGAHFQLTSDNDQEATIDATNVVEVSFENTRDDRVTGGYGVENSFKLDGDSGDWPVTVTPGSSRTNQPDSPK